MLFFNIISYAQEGVTYNSLDRALSMPNQVYALDLTLGELTELPPMFHTLVNLRELYLGANQLTTLPDDISKLNNLRNLNLSANKISV